MVKVLDNGYVEVLDHLGSDLTVANAARQSYGKRHDKFEASDERLIRALADNGHTSPFRHCYVTFDLKAPIYVMRQWMKHRIGSEFSERSGRYTAESSPGDYYIPKGLDTDDCQEYRYACDTACIKYARLLKHGVSREQARGLLPQAMYTSCIWTASLQAIAHFVNLRTEAHAQYEIQQYANAVDKLVGEIYPVSMTALTGG